MGKLTIVRIGDILRSLVFYPVFYCGTAAYVSSAWAASLFDYELMQRVCAAWSGFHRFCARYILGIRVVVEGCLPEEGVLVAVKHESFFEAIDMPFLLHQPAVFAKAELLEIPFWGRLARAYGLIPVDRDGGARSLRTMIAAARQSKADGRLLTIFPEGTRIPHGSERPLQSGFAGLYKLMAQPVVPIAVDSGPLYHRTWKHKGTITYRVGEVIPAGLPRQEIEQRVISAINALNSAVPHSP